ncbi:hypothetical protein TNCV_1092371 [Trichonephila clavipes]|nr:hypothetical protein TNCV_1092371 [Trichonephila clavipes]
MVLKANDRRTSWPCHDEFRGPRSDYVRQVALATTTKNYLGAERCLDPLLSFIEQNLMPDRKFTPSGDKPFENGMNSLRFCESVLCGGQKLILRLKTTLGTLQHVPRDGLAKKFGRG